MARPRTWTDEQLIATVQMSRTWLEVAGRLGLAGPTDAMRTRARELELDVSHFVRIGNIDTRPYFDGEDADDANPYRRLDRWVVKRQACEGQITQEVIRLYRLTDEPLFDIAGRAGMSVIQVAEIVRGTARRGAGRARG